MRGVQRFTHGRAGAAVREFEKYEQTGEIGMKAGIRKRVLVVAVMVLMFSFVNGSNAVAGQTANVEYYGFSSAEEKKLPFSEAVRIGNLLFLSGQVGNIPGSLDLASGGIQAETRQTLENIKAILEKRGSSLAEVVKCTVFLADISEWSAMNEVYIEYFPVNPPARSALGANGLALDARTEIECIATVPE
jgi:reactive intermediate/imine deaminase